MKQQRQFILFFIFIVLYTLQAPLFSKSLPKITLPNYRDASEAERIIAAAQKIPPKRRVLFVSSYLSGRKYKPVSKKKKKKVKKKKVKRTEATNKKPLPVKYLKTSLSYLDCMTYVEHVLALAYSDKPSYEASFLPRLVDIAFNAHGQQLFNHRRNHFTSQWAIENEKKGYLKDIARGHKDALTRKVWLNRVGKNRTYYVRDRFLISQKAQIVHYFPRNIVLKRKAPLKSGDIIALTTAKEGLDVTHMGFYVERGKKKLLRHASSVFNRIMEQDFYKYIKSKKYITGLMILRPTFSASRPYPYSFKKKR